MPYFNIAYLKDNKCLCILNKAESKENARAAFEERSPELEVVDVWEREGYIPAKSESTEDIFDFDITVKNDGETVFEGPAYKHLEINDFDGDVREQLLECKEKGHSVREFFGSGIWDIRKKGAGTGEVKKC